VREKEAPSPLRRDKFQATLHDQTLFRLVLSELLWRLIRSLLDCLVFCLSFGIALAKGPFDLLGACSGDKFVTNSLC
jgi:hypothetical protein